MFTPFDWQEGIGHRAQFVEGKLAQGLPVLAASVSEGVLVLAYRRNARKVFEIYDRLLFSAVGQQSDVEALRVAAVEFAHQEGYGRSEDDVTIDRLVATLSQPVKRAFGDFSLAPIVARSLFAEVGDKPENDRFLVLDYDGDYQAQEKFVAVLGDASDASDLVERAKAIDWASLPAAEAVNRLKGLWSPEQDDAQIHAEVVLLVRDSDSDRRYRSL